jgi:DNA-binding LytR/AlgR family response regulator
VNGRTASHPGEGDKRVASALEAPAWTRAGWRTQLAAAGLAGLFLGLIGPFGSYLSGPPLLRIAYWTCAVLLGALLYGSAARAIAAGKMRPAPAVAALVGAADLLSLPFAAAVSLAATALWPRLAMLGPLDWYGQVLAIALPLTAAGYLAAKSTESSHAPHGRERIDPEPALLGMDPKDIICLQMEDHDVRVHGPRGSHLVLATLSQALAAIPDARGLRVHRSWWVAEDSVVGAVADGRNLRLRLANGALAPVARSAVAPVRAAGWLGRGLDSSNAA